MKKLNYYFLVLLLAAIGSTAFSQNWEQTGNDINGKVKNEFAGSSVCLSGDGLTVAVGSPGRFNIDKGKVRVFMLSKGKWIQKGDDIVGEVAEDEFGWSVSLSTDGSTLAIGAPGNTKNGKRAGHVKIYKRKSDIWYQVGTNILGESKGDGSGGSISLNGDGSVIAIGSPGNRTKGYSSGQVRVYQNISGNWVKKGSCLYGSSEYEYFGGSVSINSDGNVLVVGSTRYNENTDIKGVVRVYRFIDDNWVQIGNDIEGKEAGDRFGSAVSISSDGNVIAASAPYIDLDAINTGHVRVFLNKGEAWEPIGSPINGTVFGEFFGYSLSMSSDGSVLAIGGVGTITDCKKSIIRIYQNKGDEWFQAGSDICGGHKNYNSGHCLSISSNGKIVADGSNHDSGNSNIHSGIVKVFKMILPNDNNK